MENVIFVSDNTLLLIVVCYCRENGVDCERCQHIADSLNSHDSFDLIIHPIYFDWVNRG